MVKYTKFDPCVLEGEIENGCFLKIKKCKERKGMKKFGAILLALIMTMSLCAVPAFAEGEIVIDALADVVDYYDNGVNNSRGLGDTLFGDIVLREGGEWLSYDVSEVPQGTYSVTLDYRSTAYVVTKTRFVELIVDDAAQVRGELFRSSESWAADKVNSTEIGNIYIAEDSETLKIKSASVYPINLDKITLKFVGAEDTTEKAIKIYSQNLSTTVNKETKSASILLETDYWDVASSDTATHPFTTLGSDGKYHCPALGSKVMEGSSLVQHAGDWACYDISDFKAGTYEVVLNRAHNANTKYALKVDGTVMLTPTMEKTGTTYGTYADVVLGKIYIPEGAQKLTFENMGAGSIYASYFTLKYLSEERDPETMPKFSKTGASVMPGGQGVGFYANSMNTALSDTYLNKLEVTGTTTVVLRQAGEWLAYDIEGLEPGIYTLNLSYGVRETTFYLDVYVDDVLQAVTNPAMTDKSFTINTAGICKVEIKADSKVLKIRNSSSSVAYINNIELSYLGKTTTDKYTITHNADHVTRRDSPNSVVIESGVDFYDKDGKTALMVEGSRLVLNPGDWARYDVEGIKKGTYALKFNYASHQSAHFSIKANGYVVMTSRLAPTTEEAGSYSTNVESEIGYIYFDENVDSMIIQNNGAASIYLTYLTLEYVSEEPTNSSIRLLAENVIPGGEGVGFHDAGGANKLEISTSGGGSIIFRHNDWVKYDITGIKPGTYSISLNGATTAEARMKVSLDDSVKIIAPTLKTGGYGVFEDNYLGSIYIADGSEILTIESLNEASMYFAEIVLDYVSEEDQSSLSLAFPGTSVYQPEGFTEEGVSFYDAGNNPEAAGPGLEKSGGGVVLRSGDWVRYDLSQFGLSEGVYSVFVKAGINKATALEIEAEGTDKKRTSALVEPDDNGEFEIGKLVVGEDSKYFTISIGNVDRVILYTIRIATAYEDTTIKFTSDAAGKTAIDSLSGLETAYANVHFVRPNVAEIGGTVYVALYEGNKLVNVQLDAITTGYDFEKTYQIDSLGENAKVKVFYWDAQNAPLLEETLVSAQ